MKQPKLLFLLVTVIILALLVVTAEAQNQLTSPQTPPGDAPLPIAQNLEVVQHRGGWVKSLVVHGSYAYTHVGTELQVFSMTNPITPTLVSSLVLDRAIEYLYASGSYLYVGHYPTAYLTIIDISDPAEPIWVGSLELPYQPYNIEWYGMAVTGTNLLIATSEGLLIVDVSDPTDPQFTSSHYDEVWSVLTIDHYAYFARHEDLFVMDVSNPAAPVETYHQAFPSADGGGDMALVGNYLFFFGNPTIILDVTNPAAPQEAGETKYTAYDAQIVDGTYLYLFTEPYVTVLDITNPLEPIWLGVSEFAEGIREFHVENGYIYTTRWDGLVWLVTFDTAIPQSPIEVSSYLLSNDSLGMGKFIVDEYLYLGLLQIYDISDPLSPLLLSSFDWDSNIYSWDFAIQDNFAYVTSSACHRYCYSYFSVMDVSNPLTPTLSGSHLLEYFEAYRIKLSGHYAFAKGYSGVYAVYDIADPTNPFPVQMLPNEWLPGAIDLVTVGDYLYVTTYSNPGGTLEIVDFSNPAEPTAVGSYQTSQLLTSVNVVGAYLYVIGGAYPNETLHVLDISNPAEPVEVNTFHLPPYVNTSLSGQPLIEGNYAYLGHNVIDITDPANPTWVGFYPLKGTWGAQGDYIYVSNFPDGWHVLKRTPVMVALTPGVANSMTYTYYQHFPTQFDFPAASVTKPITIAVNPSTAEDINGYVFARHTFGLSALQGDTQLPSFTFAAPITVTLRYSPDDIDVISNEAELALWVWTENGWQDATTTCHDPAPYLRDVINNVLTLTICQTGRFALFGPTHQRYFPFIDRH